jgi:hypothetical protein
MQTGLKNFLYFFSRINKSIIEQLEGTDGTPVEKHWSIKVSLLAVQPYRRLDKFYQQLNFNWQTVFRFLFDEHPRHQKSLVDNFNFNKTLHKMCSIIRLS